jgi:hypothetical protein
MTESQKAFEDWWVSCHQTPCENRFGAVRDGRNAWQAAEAYGRKQALEEAILVCKKNATPGTCTTDYAQGYNAGAHVCRNEIQELIK